MTRRLGIHLIAWAIGLIWLIPFVGIVMSSLRPQRELIHGWWNLSPFTLSLDNFIEAWNHPSAPLGQGIRNSLIVVIPATIVPLFIGAMAAYGFLRFRVPFSNTLFLIIVLLMSIPQQMVAVPLFRFMRDVGLLDTYTGLVLVHSAWALPWVILFLRNYLSTLPPEIEEAASLDGANRFQIFTRIVLPLSVPGLASAMALQLTWAWNDFFMALILLFDPDKLVATQRIPLLRGQYQVDWGVLTAASLLTMSVPILVFALLQRYYIRGLVGWTLK